MAVKHKPLTLEALTKPELIALARGLFFGEVDLWRARCDVHSDEVKALTKAHEVASQRVAPFRTALYAADTSSPAWNKAHRALRAAEAEKSELWRRLEAAWARCDALHEQLDRAYEQARVQWEAKRAEATDV